MKFVIALLLANTSAIRLRQMDAPAPLPTDTLFAASFSDAPIAAGFVQLNEGPPAELGAAAAKAPAPAAAKGKVAAADAPPTVADAAKEAAAAKAPAADAPKAADAKAAKEPAPANPAGAKEAKAEPASTSPKAEAAKKAAEPIVEENKAPKSAESDAKEKEAKAKAITAENKKDMKSVAATWAGSGAPPPLSKGDVATMAAPRPGFDPSLNPGAPDAVESNHTTATAAAEAALKAAPAGDAKTALIQKKNKEGPPAELAPKAAAAKKAEKDKAEVAAAGRVLQGSTGHRGGQHAAGIGLRRPLPPALSG